MRILFLTALLIFLAENNLFSQRLDSPITPIKESGDKELGIFAGLGGNIQNGSMYVDCETCEFNSGSHLSFTFGLLYQLKLNDWFKFGFALSYDDFSMDSEYTEVTSQSYDAEIINVPFTHKAELNMNGISAFPYLQFDRLDFAFLRVGPGISYILDRDLTHTMTLAEERIITNDGRVIDLNLLDGNNNEVIFEDNELNDYSDLLYYVNLYLGFNIELNNWNILSPAFEYKIPLNNISDFKKSYKISTWHILLEYRYFISKSRKP